MTSDDAFCWRSVAARSVGTSHRAIAAPCQDHVIVDVFSDHSDQTTALLAAVADGAGSASESERGASKAVSYAIASVKRRLVVGMPLEEVEQVLRNAALEARDEIIRTAAQEQRCLRDFSTTLLLAVAVENGAAFVQIGDGAIVFGNSDALDLAFAVEQEMLNVTDFLTDDAAPQLLRSRVAGVGIDRLAVLSDGLAPLLIDQRLRRPHQPAFASLFGHIARTEDTSALSDDLRAFLDSPAVNERTDDDKSLVLACRMQRP